LLQTYECNREHKRGKIEKKSQFRTPNKCAVDKIISRVQLHQFKFEGQSSSNRRPRHFFQPTLALKRIICPFPSHFHVPLSLPFLIQCDVEVYHLFLCLPSPSAATHISLKIDSIYVFIQIASVGMQSSYEGQHVSR